ncbi:AAA family ATPase [Methylocaldum sp. BRCS4]|jgi:hypothetical protein|uniref:AAA family ATPase n=1 Tax=Methylocaldum sp. GT1BB TaxID=3438963 RepID=UPI000A326836|nr:AAA family ATPase [Methylocaldum sp. BRCS4]
MRDTSLNPEAVFERCATAQDGTAVLESAEVLKMLQRLFLWQQSFGSSKAVAPELGELAHRLAQFFSFGEQGMLNPELAEALERIAAALGHFEATYSLACRSDATLDLKAQAFALGLPELRRTHRDEPENDTTRRLIRLIEAVARQAPQEALRWVGQLIGAVLDSPDLAPRLPEVRAVGEQVVSSLGSGVYVLEAVSPSKDKVVAEALKRYQVRLELPTPLAPVPDLQHLQQTLNEEFPWFGRVTDWVIRQLSARALGRGYFQLSPLLLLGDPGLGKSSYVNRLGQLSKVPVQLISLGGKADARDLIGTARGWASGHPSRPLTAIHEGGVANPIIVCDEIDKPGSATHNGHPWDALLSLFEPATAARFFDEFLGGHANLSFISWISTANSIRLMPTALLNRLAVMTVPAPQREHYPAIVARCIEQYRERNGIPRELMPTLTSSDWRWLERYYTSPRTVRRATELWLEQRLVQQLTARLRH